VEKFKTKDNFVEHFVEATKSKRVLVEAVRAMDILEEL
jgi:hypothetical protein